MGELFYVGPDAVQNQEIETVSAAEVALNSSDVTRSVAQDHINSAVTLRANKSYVDTQDELYADSSYHENQNQLLIPSTARGVANGVASLDANAKIPASQIPILGSGVLKGPYGYNTSYGPATGASPAKVCEWNAASYGVNGWPLVFMNISTQATDARTVIEVRIGNSTQTTYAAQTLIAQGFGRTSYKDYQTISVLPVTANNGQGQNGSQQVFSAGTSWLITAWMYNSGTGSSSTQTGQISTAALYWVVSAL